MGLRTWQKQYYVDMMDRKRGFMVFNGSRLIAMVTYLIGDDDKKYLVDKEPWVLIDDDPSGSTVYIDQMITKEPTHKYIHREVTKGLRRIKQDFPNVTKAKWLRAPALFRKKGVRDDKAKLVIHCKNIK